nr:class I SAM-dependent methyltransferase [Janibacter cremeus]
MVIHDLGCGTGSMARWLAPQLPGNQRWIGYERDEDLLNRAAAAPPPVSLDGLTVTTETRLRDITHLPTEDLDGASLITASALLDMMTREELERMVASIAAAGCPALITLSVIGQVDLAPAHPLDDQIAVAFNAHQRRDTGHGPLAGPDAVYVAAHALRLAGYTLHLTPSPWRLDSSDTALLKAWLKGWVDAACEQDPSLRADASEYRGRRIQQIGSRELTAMIHHRELLALP